VGDFVPGCYSGADAASLVELFARAERLCGAGKTLAATRAAEAKCHQAKGHRSAATWLADVTGESVHDALGTLAVGDALARQPGVEEAFRQGKLSRPGARAVTEAAAVNPEAEQSLVETATSDTLVRLHAQCQQVKAEGRSRADQATRDEALRRSRFVRTWSDRHDGAFRLEARLTPDAGAALAASLAAATDRVAAGARKASMVERREALAADALVDLVCGTTGGNEEPEDGNRGGDTGDTGDTGTSGAGECPPDRDEQADGEQPSSRTPPRATVSVRVDLDALRNGIVGRGQCCEIPGVGPISVEVARSIMGEALTKVVITNGVDVTTVCSLGRSIPQALLDALIERDPRCVVPGCDETAHLEIDHLLPYAEGGPTRLSNLARLCHFHHGLKTHKGFTLAGSPGHWSWVPPKGRAAPPGGPAPPDQHSC